MSTIKVRPNLSGFAVTHGKGFHITFANGWTVTGRCVTDTSPSSVSPGRKLDRMLHIGRKVPKALAARGWREGPQSMHLGRGIWVLVLVRERAVSGGTVERPQ